MNQRLALFDMDGSLADYHGQILSDLRNLASPQELLDEKKMWEMVSSLHELEDRYPYLARRMDLIKLQPGWWANLKPLEVGFRALQYVQEMGFKVEVLSRGPRTKPRAWAEKVEWCRTYGLNDYHVVSDKSRFFGHVLYDDYGPYLSSWLDHHPQGLGIQPVSEWNQPLDHPRVLQWTGENITELQEYLGRLA